MTADDILQLIREDDWMMTALKTAASLNLPDWWLGSGFVRNKIWDHLHGYTTRTPLADLDLIYFEPANEVSEKAIEERLKLTAPDYPWEVVNQATIHLWNKQAPYKNSIDALSRWGETATSIAVTLRTSDHLELAAPYGIDDLVSLIIRPTPHPEAKPHVFEDRLASKPWYRQWPKLRVVREPTNNLF